MSEARKAWTRRDDMELQRRAEAYPRLVAAVREYIDATDQSAFGDDEVANMLRLGEADTALRSLLRELKEME